jgi:hypothetical protein
MHQAKNTGVVPVAEDSEAYDVAQISMSNQRVIRCL